MHDETQQDPQLYPIDYERQLPGLGRNLGSVLIRQHTGHVDVDWLNYLLEQALKSEDPDLRAARAAVRPRLIHIGDAEDTANIYAVTGEARDIALAKEFARGDRSERAIVRAYLARGELRLAEQHATTCGSWAEIFRHTQFDVHLVLLKQITEEVARHPYDRITGYIALRNETKYDGYLDAVRAIVAQLPEEKNGIFPRSIAYEQIVHALAQPGSYQPSFEFAQLITEPSTRARTLYWLHAENQRDEVLAAACEAARADANDQWRDRYEAEECASTIASLDIRVNRQQPLEEIVEVVRGLPNAFYRLKGLLALFAMFPRRKDLLAEAQVIVAEPDELSWGVPETSMTEYDKAKVELCKTLLRVKSVSDELRACALSITDGALRSQTMLAIYVKAHGLAKKSAAKTQPK